MILHFTQVSAFDTTTDDLYINSDHIVSLSACPYAHPQRTHMTMLHCTYHERGEGVLVNGAPIVTMGFINSQLRDHHAHA